MQRYRYEIGLAVMSAVCAMAWRSGYLLTGLAAGVVAVVLAAVVLVRLGRHLLRRAIWHLRDRLIFAYVFIAVIPIAVIVLAARWVVLDLGGQIAVYLVNTELERRVGELEQMARALADAPPERRTAIREQIATVFRDRFPGLEVQQDEGPGDLGPAGIVSRSGMLYVRARALHRSRVRMALVAPLSRDVLARLAPGLGPISIIARDAAQPLRLHPSAGGGAVPELPPAVNRFDIELRWASQIQVADLDDPARTHDALLGVRSRVSMLLRTLFAEAASEGGADLRNDMILAGVLLLLTQAVSVYIGVTVTQAITRAFNGLHEGTQRVMRGDFSHRIPVRGDDQIAEVTDSFNRMTGHIEQLLEVSKQKERVDAELKIARQVQDQLFPRAVPELRTLELRAECQAARMVSGDYYDYQPIGGGRAAMVLADVAGKGVSAALLMASLQACFRMQAHDLLTEPGTAGAPVSTAGLVAHINVQLHASTAAEKFATFFLGIYDDATGQLTYTNAGHLPPILVRRGGKASFLDVNGMVVGAFPFARYGESRVTLEPGDILFGYTDGVTEAENEFGEMFGEQRLIEVLSRCHDQGAEIPAIFQTVAAAVRQFSGSPELQDDMTMIAAVRRSGV